VTRHGGRRLVGITVRRRQASDGGVRLLWACRDLSQVRRLETEVERLHATLRVHGRLAALQRLLGVPEPLPAFLDRLLTVTSTLCPGSEMTVMLTDGMQAASSGDAAAELAALEVEQGEGAANARLYQMVSDRGANLERALEYRGAIERAKGLIMHERGVDANEAFEVLREISQRQNRKLRDVAIELLARNAGSQAASRQPPHR
jgi:hypothetical protein